MGLNSNKKKIRSFFAIELPEEIRSIISDDIIVPLKKVPAKVRWVKPQNIHLTLRFLGKISPKIISDISLAAADIAKSISPISLRIDSIGTFRKRNPRIVWLGVGGEIEKLRELHSEVERICCSVGFTPDDRKFSPHITIGRIKSPAHTEKLLAQIKKLSIKSLDFSVKEFILFKSTLTPNGPIYDVVEKFAFKA